MKKTSLLIIATVCAFMLSSCGGKQKTYTYVEPTENIAYKIWNLLTQENQEVKPVVDAAIEFDYYTQEEATDTISKTELEYDYIIPRGFAEEDNFLAANYHLKCFQKFDDTWIGIIIKDVHGYGLDEADCGKELLAVHYDGNKTTELDINQLFPEWFGFIQDYYAESCDNCFYFSNDAMTFATTGYWPIKLNWNGNGFEKDPESVIMTNSVQMSSGEFCYYEKGKFHWIQIGDSFYGEGNNLLDENGNVLAHFDVNNGIVEGYTLESPTCGVVQDFDYVSELGNSMITSKPIALGYPIQNVLEYEKGYWLKDTVVSQGMKDGKYIITQQIAHDKIRKKRDIFIDFMAQDEHSNIEQIRVYSYPITITMENEVNESEDLNAHVKEIFNALGYDFQSPEFGEFDHFIGHHDDKNGFDFYFNGEVKNVRFQTYDAGEKQLVVVAKYGEDEKLMDINSWYYQDGSFKETILDLPIPMPEEFEAYTRNDDYDIKLENYILSFYDKGIEYYAITERNDGSSMRDEDGIFINPDFYTKTYQWNGKKFE